MSFLGVCHSVVILLTVTLVTSSNDIPPIFDESRRHLSDSLYSKCIAPVNKSAKHPDENIQKNHEQQLATFKSFIRKGRCDHLYLDIGTNVGISLRKLYEPNLFQNATLIPYFNKNFGPMTKRDRVCSVGFEPNSKHVKRLTALEQTYQTMGWPMVIFTRTGVATMDGTLNINRDNSTQFELGAGMFHSSNRKEIVVALDLSHFLLKIYKLWEGVNHDRQSSRIVAKMDIEGSEFSILPHMLQMGSLCLINEIAIEYHEIYTGNYCSLTNKEAHKAIKWMTTGSKCDNFTVISLDDESYRFSNFPLPIPH